MTDVTLFRNKSFPVFAMAQPAPLPGSCRYGGEGIGKISHDLLEEIRLLDSGGVDGVILQNFHDGPVKQSAAPEAVSYLTRLACDIRREFPNLLLGILACWDGPASVLIAEASQADFVRVEHVYCGAELTAAGMIEGQCVEVQQLKRKLCSHIPVYADACEPHSTPLLPRPVEAAAYDCVYGGLADGLFLCGKTPEESISLAQKVRASIPGIPLICGGGSNAFNVASLLSVYDGVCVGAWIKNGDLANPVDPKRLKQYMDAVKQVRRTAECGG